MEKKGVHCHGFGVGIHENLVEHSSSEYSFQRILPFQVSGATPPYIVCRSISPEYHRCSICCEHLAVVSSCHRPKRIKETMELMNWMMELREPTMELGELTTIRNTRENWTKEAAFSRKSWCFTPELIEICHKRSTTHCRLFDSFGKIEDPS